MAEVEDPPKSASENQNSEGPITIYVANLPYTEESDEIKDLFKVFGQVEHVFLRRRDGAFTGTAFVTMSRMVDGLQAVSMLNGTLHKLMKLKVERAKRPFDPNYKQTRFGDDKYEVRSSRHEDGRREIRDYRESSPRYHRDSPPRYRRELPSHRSRYEDDYRDDDLRYPPRYTSDVRSRFPEGDYAPPRRGRYDAYERDRGYWRGSPEGVRDRSPVFRDPVGYEPAPRRYPSGYDEDIPREAPRFRDMGFDR
jgi:RNA recognition motif-containing protein